MDTVSIDDVKELSKLNEAVAVSIYFPTHLAPDARQDAVRLKNLLERVEDELESRGMRRSEAVELLTAARKLPGEVEFWKALSQGLAIFLTPRLFRAYRLPLAFDESITIHNRLNVKPLLSVADRGERFLLLALSQNHVRLFEMTRTGAKEVAIKGLPKNKRQALNYDGVDRGEQVHEGMRGNLGKQAGIFHGQGGVKDTAKADLTQFFQSINRALDPMLHHETVPLLLAGVDYLLPLFRQTCSYPHLLERHLTGNYDLLTSRKLHERSWEIMRPVFDRPRREALEKLSAFLGTGKASADLAEVGGAAMTGKIDTLFADVRQEQQGTLDTNVGRAMICDHACDAAEGLVILAVAETLQHGGVVYATEPQELPGGAAVAAIYRY